ncbi:MAG: adenylate/guanylate cyclase domain-containing protein [Treponema sp.]|nr:adenylate/guanylate cyclase domain-containing protein [Treponema sp.]
MDIKHNRRAIDNIRFSIGAKLITIISIIVIISLGSITALVSWLVQSDLQVTAEENNFETNLRSATEAESLVSNVRSNSKMLIQTITALGTQSSVIEETTEFFWTENPQIASVFFIAAGRQEQLMVNHQFFSSRDIDVGLVPVYFNKQRTTLGRAVRGEIVLRNAAPDFSRAVLALFFPWQNGGVGGVLFSSENMNNNFGFGVNQSFMINTDGELLSHADFSLLKEETNIADLDFIRSILDSPERNRQSLLESDFGIMQSLPRTVETNAVSAFFNNISAWIQPYLDEIKNFFAGIGIGKRTDDKTVRQFVAYTKLNSIGAVVITNIEYDRIFEGIIATTRRNIYLTIAVLSISIIFIWFFSKTISIPLKSLAVAARQIETGRFELDLQAKTHDEIGVLTSSFHKMCSALHIFGRFTNKEIAVKAMRGEIKPGGFPKHGTVFFSDIREFTAKSEHFTRVFGAEASNKIVNWLNDYFTQMIDCVEKTNGVVDKFIGDAVMAHWGTAYSAGSPRNDAFNCIKAALMMRKALYFMNKNRKPGDPADPPIRIGCGINSGIVTAGQLGSNMRMEYTVIGDPVNLASRIEALTKPLGVDILISEDTWNLVGDKFITEEMPPVTVKGKEKPVRIFAIVNFTGEERGPQTIGEVRSLLGIDVPVLDAVDVNKDEKKYTINKVKKGNKQP